MPCVRWHFYPREESFSVSYQMEQPSFATNQVVDWRLMSSFHCGGSFKRRVQSPLQRSESLLFLFDRLSLSNECCGMAGFAYLSLQLTLMHAATSLRHGSRETSSCLQLRTGCHLLMSTLIWIDKMVPLSNQTDASFLVWKMCSLS